MLTSTFSYNISKLIVFKKEKKKSKYIAREQQSKRKRAPRTNGLEIQPYRPAMRI